MPNLYKESKERGNEYRREQLDQILNKIKEKQQKSVARRKEYFKPDFSSKENYVKSMDKYRIDLIKGLGWPMTEYRSNLDVPEADIIYEGEDELGKIYRLNINIMEGMTVYGILFLPKSEPPYTLVISQHGGGGTAELCSGLFDGTQNYNDMTRRVLRKGFAVFAPQLMLWNENFGPEFNRSKIDNDLKQVGGSITSLEVFKIIRSIDYLAAREDMDSSRIGMIGLSYGGFFAIFTSALDRRIKAAVSSCYFNNRLIYNQPDLIWFDSANTFLDAEVCALISPKPFYIEVGKEDELFDVKHAGREFERIKEYYNKLGCSENLKYVEFDGGHELDKCGNAINFLYNELHE
jgi:dienelactone hydrolase